MNVKFQNLYTLTRADITKIKKEAREEAIQELCRRQEDVIGAVQEGSERLVLLTGYTALMDMGCDYDFAMEFGLRVADIVTQINNGEVTEDQLEGELAEFGIELVKEEQK